MDIQQRRMTTTDASKREEEARREGGAAPSAVGGAMWVPTRQAAVHDYLNVVVLLALGFAGLWQWRGGWEQ